MADPTGRDAPPPEDDDLADILSPLLAAEAVDETCDTCGSADTWWRNCKLLCRACGNIVKSCADL